MADDGYSTRTEGPTPAGGTYSLAYWIGAVGARATRETARAVETIEFDDRDREIRRTYATLTRAPVPDVFGGGE